MTNKVNTKSSSIKTINPTTNQVEKVFEEMDDKQLDSILSNAEQAFLSWKATSFTQRATLLHKVAEIMIQRKDELARLAALEMGKLYREGLAEVALCADILDYYAHHGADILADRPLVTEHGKAFLAYSPIGVLLTVQPWNFPFYQITRAAAANIMAGNTVVLKHASNVPQCAAIVEQIYHDAGIPAGVYTNIFVSGARISELVADFRVKGVSLTGSESSGASFAAVAGKHVKKSTLELGGSDAFIVLADADIEQAAQAAAFGRLINAGQVCISPKRIIVLESIAQTFIEKTKAIYETIKIGEPLDDSTQLGPLCSELAVERVLKQVNTAIKQGATLIYGGHRLDRAGAFMQPTILTNIKPGTQAYSQEIFGPVLCIYVVATEQQAIELANDTDFGLGGSVFSQDIERAVAVARQIDTGMVYINSITNVAPELPFGGTKKSGYGKEQSAEGMREFVNAKLIHLM